jgi:hypothetical protein
MKTNGTTNPNRNEVKKTVTLKTVYLRLVEVMKDLEAMPAAEGTDEIGAHVLVAMAGAGRLVRGTAR